MTNPDFEDDDQNDVEDGSEKYARVPRAQVRTWEKQSKAAQQAEERAAKAERRLALLEAGVDSLNERQQRAVFADIDGDITAEAVRKAAEELGFVQPPKDEARDAEAEALDRFAQASTGASEPSQEDAVARLDRAEREGGYDGLIAQLRADGSLAS